MKRRPSSAPSEPMDTLLHTALQTCAEPDAALLSRVRRQVRQTQPRQSAALPFLAALGGTALTAALAFALTVLFPNPPLKQIIEALGALLCGGTWIMAALSMLLAPRFQERILR